MPRPATRRRLLLSAVSLSMVAVVAACGSSTKGSSATTAPSSTTTGPSTTGPSPTSSASSGVTAAGISKEECAANKAAGKITYLSGFDFSASASILDVEVAKDKGYFDAMCLDVDLKPGFSTTDYPLVASGAAQFASGGNYTETLNFAKGGAKFVVVVDYGKVPIEALLVRGDGKVNAVGDLKGKTIGEKGDIPPSIVALLAQAGLVRGSDYKEVLLQGFDPEAQLKQPIDALPVYKSGEPGQLDRKGISYKLFDPADTGIPGSFGILYTSPSFLKAHPSAVQDFVRAALKGYADAVADPAGAVALAIKRINAAGTQNYLTQEGETYRGQQESAVVKRGTPVGEPVGLVDEALLKAEVGAYAKIGVFKGAAPATDGTYDTTVARGVYDESGKVIWPAG
jgi:ABC-type nitrate/sulfonate/bicarbonate transport system substrate-binding protein